MKRRIAMWAGVGFLIGCGWVLYTFVVPVEFLAASLRQPVVLAAIYATCPICYAGRHFPLHFWWVPPINAATYALIGLIVEMVRRTARQQLAV
jgi:CHASE2 domain-containing sensor protein